MALRLSKDLKKENPNPQGFDLKFTKGKVYNLDDILKLKDRADSTQQLKLNVKHEKDIAEAVLAKLQTDSNFYVNTFISNHASEIREKLGVVSKQIYTKYNCDYYSLPKSKAAEDELNSIMNLYLISLLDGRKDYTILFRFNDMNYDENTVAITWQFSSSEVLASKFNEYYLRYATEFDNLLKVKEGELAITDIKSKTTIDKTDYKKYLLSDEKSTKGSNPSPILTTKKPQIIWENGTDDKTEEEEPSDIYSEIKKLYDLIELLKNNPDSTVNSIKELQEKITELDDYVNKNLSITSHIIREYGQLKTDKELIPNVGAVSEFIENYIHLDEVDKPYDLDFDETIDYVIGSTLFSTAELVLSDTTENYFKLVLPSYYNIIENQDNETSYTLKNNGSEV